MALSNDTISMALYCDFENVALGVRDAKYDRFDIKPVLERLLLKGSIVVKKAYCDWDRYKEFKPPMHEASFELIEIPHLRQSGKNSADIRMVVDALDLCYTKAHVNTFVIISGDSDFSPLVSKLRENAKYVIGVGVKNSSSDLLIANCDEFIFIDDLVRESRRTAATREVRQAPPTPRRSPDEEKRRKDEQEARRSRGVEIAVETFDALMAERGDSGKIWASALKQAIKRRKPDFNEVYFGFRSFGNLLEEAQSNGLLEIGRDDKSGAYVYRSNPSTADGEAMAGPQANLAPDHQMKKSAAPVQTGTAENQANHGPRRSGRGGQKPRERAPTTAVKPPAPAVQEIPVAVEAALQIAAPEMVADAVPEVVPEAAGKNKPPRNEPAARKPTRRKTQVSVAPAPVDATVPVAPSAPIAMSAPVAAVEPVAATAEPGAAPESPAATAGKTAKKSATRSRRPRKSETAPANEAPKE
jgi:uncharacterized LabA/DUF88 family protein